VPGLELTRRAYAGGDLSGLANHDDRVQCGVPGMELMERFKIPYGEATGHLDLSPVSTCTGRDVMRLAGRLRELYGRHGIEYVAGLIIEPRSVLHITTTFYDTRDEQQTAWRRHWTIETLTALEGHLAASQDTGKFCHGDTPTMADICMVGHVHAANIQQISLARWPTVKRIFETAMALPEFSRASPLAQPDTPEAMRPKAK